MQENKALFDDVFNSLNEIGEYTVLKPKQFDNKLQLSNCLSRFHKNQSKNPKGKTFVTATRSDKSVIIFLSEIKNPASK